jgi:hypothetical protein
MTNVFKATVLLAVAAGATTAVALAGTDAAAAHTTRHTMHLTTRQLQDRIVRGVDIAADKDLQHGRPTGYDVTSCRINLKTHIAHCDVALARTTGLLFGRVSINVNSGRGRGTVLGGTRGFHGATGTITAAMPRVTIVWSN